MVTRLATMSYCGLLARFERVELQPGPEPEPQPAPQQRARVCKEPPTAATVLKPFSSSAGRAVGTNWLYIINPSHSHLQVRVSVIRAAHRRLEIHPLRARLIHALRCPCLLLTILATTVRRERLRRPPTRRQRQ